ncbi:MAG: hypothetical protein EOO59_00645 [Hymenobacter sp.]|nr:MAG: hypothetical protein EOO59_00645 [Hymenobacter sp.]
MKLLGILGLVLLLALGSSLVGHGARCRAGRCGRAPRRAAVRVIRSARAVEAPKTVRAVRAPQ